MVDTVAISALVISIVGAFGAFIKEAHLRKCKACCIESDCRQNKPITPTGSISQEPTMEKIEKPPVKKHHIHNEEINYVV